MFIYFRFRFENQRDHKKHSPKTHIYKNSFKIINKLQALNLDKSFCLFFFFFRWSLLLLLLMLFVFYLISLLCGCIYIVQSIIFFFNLLLRCLLFMASNVDSVDLWARYSRKRRYHFKFNSYTHPHHESILEIKTKCVFF